MAALISQFIYHCGTGWDISTDRPATNSNKKITWSILAVEHIGSPSSVGVQTGWTESHGVWVPPLSYSTKHLMWPRVLWGWGQSDPSRLSVLYRALAVKRTWWRMTHLTMSLFHLSVYHCLGFYILGYNPTINIVSMFLLKLSHHVLSFSVTWGSVALFFLKYCIKNPS